MEAIQMAVKTRFSFGGVRTLLLFGHGLIEQATDGTSYDSNPSDDIERSWGGDKITVPGLKEIQRILELDSKKMSNAQKLDLIEERLRAIRDTAKKENASRSDEPLPAASSANQQDRPNRQLNESACWPPEKVRRTLRSNH